MVARNEKKIQQIISGLKSKYPNLDVSNLEEKVQRTQGYMNEPLHIGFNAGGEPLLRAVGKIAINSYLCGNGDQQYIQSILEVVKGNAANDNYIHFYPVADSLHWESKEVSHLVHIRGDASKRLLYGYVVLFSSFAYIVNFSDQYGGPNLETTYCYDVVASTQVKRNFSLDYPGRLAFMAQTASEQEQHKWNNTIISTIQVNANRVLSIGNRIQINRGISEITTEVATEVFGKYPDGTIITETILQEYIEAVTAKAVPFILNANNRRTNKGKG